jgi:hypothetical protein
LCFVFVFVEERRGGARSRATAGRDLWRRSNADAWCQKRQQANDWVQPRPTARRSRSSLAAMSRIGKWTDPLLGPSPHLAGWPAEHRYELLVVEVDRAPYRFAPFERPLRRLARLREYIIMVGGGGVVRRSRRSARARGGRSTKETREARDERRETRGERRGTRDETRRAREERRETRDKRRDARDERRETRDERRETRDERREARKPSVEHFLGTR